ncbi:MAG TPA: hypothetical protein VE223_05355 [Nitrososphaeraceae archaeon]|nr:hypothetical protein [Nitrososphaeraceae archaeon]
MLEYIAKGSHIIGIMPFRRRNHDKAMKLFEESLELSKEIEDRRGITIFMIRLGNVASKEAGLV